MAVRPIVAFDESGNTGEDLLNAEQPVFALASVQFGVDEAKSLLDSLPVARGQEAKFKKLKNSGVGRTALLQLLSSAQINDERVKVVFYHKSYMVTTKMVDMLVETLAYRHGVDLYRRGANLGLANLWHTVLPVFMGEKMFRKLQTLFVAMVRSHTRGSVDAFYSFVQFLHDMSVGETWHEDIGMLLATRSVLREALGVPDATALEPAIPAMVTLLDYWGRQLGEEFDVLQDRSKPIASSEDVFKILMSKDEPETVVGYDRRTSVFPLKATGITFADSHAHPELQVADIVAGAIAHWTRGIARGNFDPFAHALGETRLSELSVNPIWPSSAVTPEELGTDEAGGVNAVDYVAQLVGRKRAEMQRD